MVTMMISIAILILNLFVGCVISLIDYDIVFKDLNFQNDQYSEKQYLADPTANLTYILVHAPWCARSQSLVQSFRNTTAYIPSLIQYRFYSNDSRKYTFVQLNTSSVPISGDEQLSNDQAQEDQRVPMKIQFVTVNLYSQPELVARLGVMSYPTIRYFWQHTRNESGIYDKNQYIKLNYYASGETVAHLLTHVNSTIDQILLQRFQLLAGNKTNSSYSQNLWNKENSRVSMYSHGAHVLRTLQIKLYNEIMMKLFDYGIFTK